jgi:hypothetical protein
MVPTTSQHYLTSLFHMACPKPSHRRSVFQFLAQIPPLGLTLVNVQPPHYLYHINLHPPLPSITPHCNFTRRAQNRATNALFRVFGPKPATSHLRTRSLAAAATSCHSTCYLVASPPHHIFCGAHKSESLRSVCLFFLYLFIYYIFPCR